MLEVLRCVLDYLLLNIFLAVVMHVADEDTMDATVGLKKNAGARDGGAE